MRTSLIALYSLLLGLWVATSCTSQDSTKPCGPPGKITVDSACYAGNGLVMTASEYGGSPLSFDWEIHAVKDTSTVIGWTSEAFELKPISSNKYTVPDSIVNKYPKLIVSVASNCEGALKHSVTYGFIKRRSTANNCVTWKPL